MKRMLVGLMVLGSMAAVAHAADIGGQEVTTTVDLTYTTKYIWRGFDILDDVSAWQPSVNFDFGNGFSANVWASYAGSGGTTDMGNSRVNATEYDYTLAYSSSINEGCPWQTDYSIGWVYYDYPDMASKDADAQEIFLSTAFPELVGGGVTPHFVFVQMWPAKGGGAVRDYSGSAYIFGFTYDFTTDQAPDLPMTFGWDIVYNDGMGGDAIDSDWSHMVWSLSTSTTCPFTGATVTPSVYYQNSFEDTVNTEDEFWASLSYSFTF